MMKSLAIGALLLGLVLLAGCSGKTVMLKSDAGQVVRCHYSGTEFFWKGQWAEKDLQECAQQYEVAGFKRLPNLNPDPDTIFLHNSSGQTVECPSYFMNPGEQSYCIVAYEKQGYHREKLFPQPQ